METRHIHWNSETGIVCAWVVQDGEIVKAMGGIKMTRKEVEKLAKEEGAELTIV